MADTRLLFKIIPEKRIVIEYWYGEVFREVYQEFKLSLIRDPLFSPNFNSIVDMREARINNSENDIDKLIKFMNDTENMVGKRKTVHLTHTPGQVVQSSLFKHKKKSLPIAIKTVSTLEAAISFVGLNECDLPAVNVYLEEFKLTKKEV